MSRFRRRRVMIHDVILLKTEYSSADKEISVINRQTRQLEPEVRRIRSSIPCSLHPPHNAEVGVPGMDSPRPREPPTMPSDSSLTTDIPITFESLSHWVAGILERIKTETVRAYVATPWSRHVDLRKSTIILDDLRIKRTLDGSSSSLTTNDPDLVVAFVPPSSPLECFLRYASMTL